MIQAHAQIQCAGVIGHYLKAEVSRAAVAHNLSVLRSRLPSGCKLCAVVKADAYGHGLAGLLETLASGADGLVVATIPEGLAIRQEGYEGKILATLAYALGESGEALDVAAEAVRGNIDMTIAAATDVPRLARLAKSLSAQPSLHLKIDTGMGRSAPWPAMRRKSWRLSGPRSR